MVEDFPFVVPFISLCLFLVFMQSNFFFFWRFVQFSFNLLIFSWETAGNNLVFDATQIFVSLCMF